MTKHEELSEADEDVGLLFPIEKPRIERVFITDVASPSESEIGLDILQPSVRRRDRKEEYAGILAIGLFILFALVVISYIVAAIFLESIVNIKEVLQVIFPVISGMLGAAVAYYHSEKTK